MQQIRIGLRWLSYGSYPYQDGGGELAVSLETFGTSQAKETSNPI